MAAGLMKMLMDVPKEPRRQIHSLKVGLALTIASLTVLQGDLYKQLGVNAIWAVMTVVVVFELTAGATVCKGLNRAFGTLLAGTLALGVEFLADLAGPKGEAYVVGISVFLIGTLATYTRFCEPFKSKYDYGVLIFLLTFSLIIVSGYRVSDNLELAVSRFLNIVLGGGICLLMTLLIKPVWASEDLHNVIRKDFDNLAKALEELTKACFKEGMYQPEINSEDDPIYDCYEAVLASKPNEESLAKFASWEPRWKSCICNQGVWNQYVHVGGALRNCTYIVASLHGCLKSNVQAFFSTHKHVSNACQNVALESIALLRELGENLHEKKRSRTKEDLIRSLLEKVENLKQVMDYLDEVPLLSPCQNNEVVVSMNGGEADDKGKISLEHKSKVINCGKVPFGGVLPITTIAFLLIELVFRLNQVLDAQKHLEVLAQFRVPKVKLDKSTISIVRDRSLDSLNIQLTD